MEYYRLSQNVMLCRGKRWPDMNLEEKIYTIKTMNEGREEKFWRTNWEGVPVVRIALAKEKTIRKEINQMLWDCMARVEKAEQLLIPHFFSVSDIRKLSGFSYKKLSRVIPECADNEFFEYRACRIEGSIIGFLINFTQKIFDKYRENSRDKALIEKLYPEAVEFIEAGLYWPNPQLNATHGGTNGFFSLEDVISFYKEDGLTVTVDEK